MDYLVALLYEKNEVFSKINERDMDDYAYIVFSGFATFINELIFVDKSEDYDMLDSYKFLKLHRCFIKDIDIPLLIENSFLFISELLNKNDAQINDVLYASVYWNLSTNKYVKSYAKKYLSTKHYDTFSKILNDLDNWTKNPPLC